MLGARNEDTRTIITFTEQCSLQGVDYFLGWTLFKQRKSRGKNFIKNWERGEKCIARESRTGCIRSSIIIRVSDASMSPLEKNCLKKKSSNPNRRLTAFVPFFQADFRFFDHFFRRIQSIISCHRK